MFLRKMQAYIPFVLFMIFILYIVTPNVNAHTSTRPTIKFLDGNKRFVNFTYDYTGRYIEVRHRFLILWTSTTKVYFKLMPANNVLIDPKADIENETGWFTGFYLIGPKLGNDLKHKNTEHFLGTRYNNTPTKSINIIPNTAYTLLLRIHVPKGLNTNTIYIGAVILAIDSKSFTENGSTGATMDISSYLELRFIPQYNYSIYGNVYYKSNKTPAKNATVTILNKDTGKHIKMECNGNGTYAVDLSVFSPGWRNGDEIVITAEYKGIRRTKRIHVDISKNGTKVDFILIRKGHDTQYPWVALAYVMFIATSMGGFIYKKREKLRKGKRMRQKV